MPIPEVTLSLVVGKEIQQAKKIPMNASGGGDYRREESPAHIQCRVAGPILDNLLLGPVREHLIDVRMAQCPIQRRVSSVAMEVMNPGNINAQPTADAAERKRTTGSNFFEGRVEDVLVLDDFVFFEE